MNIANIALARHYYSTDVLKIPQGAPPPHAARGLFLLPRAAAPLPCCRVPLPPCLAAASALPPPCRVRAGMAPRLQAAAREAFVLTAPCRRHLACRPGQRLHLGLCRQVPCQHLLCSVQWRVHSRTASRPFSTHPCAPTITGPWATPAPLPSHASPPPAFPAAFLSPAGHIVTNFHVIRGASEVQVSLIDQSTYPAKIVGGEARCCLAARSCSAAPPACSCFLRLPGCLRLRACAVAHRWRACGCRRLLLRRPPAAPLLPPPQATQPRMWRCCSCRRRQRCFPT